MDLIFSGGSYLEKTLVQVLFLLFFKKIYCRLRSSYCRTEKQIIYILWIHLVKQQTTKPFIKHKIHLPVFLLYDFLNMFIKYFFNPFLVNVPTLYPLKTLENIWFSGVFKAYKIGILVTNVLPLTESYWAKSKGNSNNIGY